MTSVVLDTSALIGILQNEPEAGILLQARFGDHGERELDLLLQRAEVEIVPVTPDHADMARQAFRRFGKGRHRAGLNFGDCFSYALAVALDARLLFTGGQAPDRRWREVCDAVNR